jgi:BNR repeat-containing family member
MKREKVTESLKIADVWAGHPVGFALLTHKDQQFVAFYGAERHMTVAQRTLGKKTWTFTRLPSQLGWDSHNYVTLAVDDGGFLHVSGNMHVNPLVYFRSTKPLDASSLVPVAAMTGQKESRVTYPLFFRGAKNELIFTYRDGGSGNGDQLYNTYALKTKTWKRLTEQVLTDGEGQRNAYLALPQLGPDGYFHLVWIWRETPDAATNHHPSYAKSRDLVHWQDSASKPLTLPITLRTGDVIDPIPEHGGAINGLVKLGFDSQKRPVVTYTKYDAKGKSQLYATRREKAGWKVYQISNWDWRWEFGGGGSIPFEINVGAVESAGSGRLKLVFGTKSHGGGVLVLDEMTLKPLETLPPPEGYPKSLRPVRTKFPEMKVKWAGDLGKAGEVGTRYILRWETLGPNRDRPRTGPLPPTSELRLYKLTGA